MVAKTYENWKTQGEVFSANGRKYIKVINPKNGTQKTVRFYEETSKETKLRVKEALGFQEGYIYLLREEEKGARYARPFGWYIPSAPFSNEESIENFPKDSLLKLLWKDIGNADGTLKSEAEVKIICDNLRRTPMEKENVDVSRFQGEIGERLEISMEVTAVSSFDSPYGKQNLHVFRDAEGNAYLWKTASKCWQVGDKKKIRGTVKEHNVYKGIKETILTRCKEL
jgi:hypothetical protein